MSDDAVVWKLGFGVLVLVFCAVVMATRKAPEEAPAPPAAAVAAPAVQPRPAPLASPPVDVQEDPPRIEAAIEDELQPQRAASHPVRRAKPRAAAVSIVPVHATHAVPPRLHRVVATRRTWTNARPHYPFDPRQRWQSREMP
jgi:hypothetical protein